MDFQISLEAARVNAKMTQEEAAAEMTVSRNTILNWESGKSEPTITQARRLAILYGLPLESIIFVPTKSNNI